MFKKRIAIAFILSLLSIVVLTVYAGSFGTSFRSGGVEGFGTVTGIRSAQQTGGAVVTMRISSVNSGGIQGVLFCGNPGVNHLVAPGVNPILVPSFSAIQNIPGDAIDKNGKASFDVLADAPLTDPAYIAFCPNPNWVPLDFVPYQFVATMTATAANDPSTILTQTRYQCVLPNPSTLQYKEKRNYNCVQLK